MNIDYKINSCLLLLLCLLFSCKVDMPQDVALAYEQLPEELNFNTDIKPILSDKCFACHGPDKGKILGGLQLHTPSTAYQELSESPGKYAIIPGNVVASEIYHRILSDDPEVVMPTPNFNLTLSPKEKATLIKWIEEGAEYQPHWAFMPIAKQDVPDIENDEKIYNEIDNFIIARLEREELSPSPEANKELLLRRVSLDLTGLPPTIAEINAFKLDLSKGAYKKQVERLLASPHYGEKMASDWLDLARFADTHGYQADRARDMSPWRDWVINAFNTNKPYDQFVTEQLAGDLIESPTREQKIATAFNRLHPQNMEGGIVDEEFRVEYVADRASVVGQGVMGLTFACARCHDHKYDPISQKNFYELYSFFNNVNETGQISWDPSDMPVPNMLLPTVEQEQKINFLKESINQTITKKEDHIIREESTMEEWITNNEYQKISLSAYKKGKVAHFNLDNHLTNSIRKGYGKMDRQFSPKETPHFTAGKKGYGLLMDGDAWLDLKPVGTYKRSDSFTIGLWVNIPKELKEGVIFHKNKGYRLHSLKGYHLYLVDNKLEIVMAHTWPENAIIRRSTIKIPKEKWTHLAMTYDGSSKAKGIQLYMDGVPIQLITEKDNLYKEIIFNNYEDIIYSKAIEPGLKIGGRWRGLGIKNAKIDDIAVYSRELTALEIMEWATPKAASKLLRTNNEVLSTTQKNVLTAHYFSQLSPDYKEITVTLAEEQKQLSLAMEDVQQMMVMKEMDTLRQAFVLKRGQYDAHGDSVFPNTPEFLPPFSKEFPKNRLGLAKWLMMDEHPLTARVAVNRYWQIYFGRGIVNTTEDFGNQGELPSHSKLLDWLALSFIESGWNIKALQKKIVLSSTYRQSSYCSDKLRKKDKENILLARGPALRLTSEMMRDNALVASNLITKKVGGKSVKPYQPKGLWAMNAMIYNQSTGDDLYRRSIYTFWKRTIPNPTLQTFDQPERSECSVKRQKTNTPLQALVVLNDPTYVEASRKIGEQITKSPSLSEGIKLAYMALTGKEITPNELKILIALQQKQYQKFKENKDKAKGWLTVGEYRVDKSLDTSYVAANTIVASVIMNSDATITKR
ncbi:DUF1553 domain-containing protein [Flammeovirga pectinis]|uniref:DUF1553 domain-containing protein n=1 Tax=Flammeovirga pectinis TaxID=2494373 RepID=A0A3S9P4N3_9BACT|nr:DUF1553 domain-containing protein [Flammeovirga pectinis]AZQ63108.1 DUF1553 domain-containing protein [Flammeovirga pectinis]